MSDESNEPGAEKGAESFLDKAKGRVKEAAGDLTGDEGLQEQGQREQQRGELKEDAAKTEAEAEKKEGEAEAKREQAEGQQQAAERREG